MSVVRAIQALPRSAWNLVLKLLFLVQPAWPVFAANAIASIALTFNGQGREALYASSDFSGPPSWLTYVGLWLFGASSFLATLLVTSQYYANLSARTWRSVGPRFWTSVVAGVFTPLAVVGELVWQHYHGGGARWAIMATAAVLVGLAVLFFRLDPRKRSLKGPFSEIVVIPPRLRRVLRVVVAGEVILGFLTVCLPAFSVVIGTLAVFFIGFSLWSVLTCYGEMMLARHRWPPLVLTTTVLAILTLAGASYIEKWSGSHNAILVVKPEHPAPPRLSAHAYAQQWLDHYLASHPGSPPPPVVVVLAEGGGIRAALHTAMVLSALDAQSCGAFFDHVYAVSSVSGGSVGVATFISARARLADALHPGCDDELAYDQRHLIADYLTQDHFAPLMAGLLFKDAPLGFLPLPLSDRSRTFEHALQGDYAFGIHGGATSGPDNAIYDGMRSDFERTVARGFPGEAPIVLFNTVRTNDGGLDVVSNVSFPADVNNRAYNLLDRLNCGAGTENSISTATAALLSARFPAITPPAVVDLPACAGESGSRRIRYVDGGYVDNSGATSATDAVSALLEVCREDQFKGRCPQILVLHIFARDARPARNGLPKTNDLLPEISGPADAWFNGLAAGSHAPVENLCRLINAPHPSQPDAGCSTLALPSTGSPESVVDEKLSIGWISAALDVGRPGDRDYVPLGWLLGKSRTHIFDTTRLQRQVRICKTFQSMMPQTVWNCARLPDPT